MRCRRSYVYRRSDCFFFWYRSVQQSGEPIFLFPLLNCDVALALHSITLLSEEAYVPQINSSHPTTEVGPYYLQKLFGVRVPSQTI